MSGDVLTSDEPQIHQTTVEKLVYMANQIADFFNSQGGHDVAVTGTADHIKSFWSGTMRRDIFAHLDKTGGEGLKPIALEAIKKWRDAVPGTIRAELEAAGRHSGREPGDDAG